MSTNIELLAKIYNITENGNAIKKTINITKKKCENTDKYSISMVGRSPPVKQTGKLAMRIPYFINLDFKDVALRKISTAFLLNATFIKKLCITETSHDLSAIPINSVHDLFIFDEKYDSKQEIADYCTAKLRLNRDAMLIHIAKKPLRKNALHLIGVPKEKFADNFSHIIGFCYLTYMIRNSLIHARELNYNFDRQ